MNQIIIHSGQWLQEHPIIISIITIVSAIKTLFWCIKNISTLIIWITHLIVKHQQKIVTFFDFLKNLAKTLSYFNVFCDIY